MSGLSRVLSGLMLTPAERDAAYRYDQTLPGLSDSALLDEFQTVSKRNHMGSQAWRLALLRNELHARLQEGTTLAYMHREA